MLHTLIVVVFISFGAGMVTGIVAGYHLELYEKLVYGLAIMGVILTIWLRGIPKWLGKFPWELWISRVVLLGICTAIALFVGTVCWLVQDTFSYQQYVPTRASWSLWKG